ncbi:uncharacterized protein [Panulirus ornatus]|uniref:uncharacterized protein n=1 Tax=Panulirus ornatus TaxID=150431 RepID=UPI003A83DF78
MCPAANPGHVSSRYPGHVSCHQPWPCAPPSTQAMPMAIALVKSRRHPWPPLRLLMASTMTDLAPVMANQLDTLGNHSGQPRPTHPSPQHNREKHLKTFAIFLLQELTKMSYVRVG